MNSRYWQLFLLTKFVCFVFSIGETWENVLTGHADVKEVCTNCFFWRREKRVIIYVDKFWNGLKCALNLSNFDVL